LHGSILIHSQPFAWWARVHMSRKPTDLLQAVACTRHTKRLLSKVSLPLPRRKLSMEKRLEDIAFVRTYGVPSDMEDFQQLKDRRIIESARQAIAKSQDLLKQLVPRVIATPKSCDQVSNQDTTATEAVPHLRLSAITQAIGG
jgi:hypothetical protein